MGWALCNQLALLAALLAVSKLQNTGTNQLDHPQWRLCAAEKHRSKGSARVAPRNLRQLRVQAIAHHAKATRERNWHTGGSMFIGAAAGEPRPVKMLTSASDIKT